LILSVWAALWLVQTTPVPVESGLLQYGAIGLMLLITLGVCRILFTRQEKLHEQALSRADKSLDLAIARADRAEEELSKLNALIREQLVAQLTQTATALSRAADVLVDQRHDERRGAR
jgi:hypothetical protein